MIRRFARRRDREPEEPEELEREHVRREPLPVARAILWKPLPDSYHLLASMMRTPEEQAQLFVTQRAFLQVERHLRSGPDLELGGFLAGHLCECPRTRTRYSVINTVLPFADVTGDPIGSRVTHKAYETVRRRLESHRLALIGWYRNGSGLGLQLLPDDIETHLAYFNEPWQTTMLVVPDASKPKGAFFTYDPRVGRGYCIPFYELFDAYAAETKRLDRTCVSWTTYVSSASVQPLPPNDREIVETTVTPFRSEPEPQPPEPIDEWVEAIKDPWIRLKDAAVGPTPSEAPIPLVDQPATRTPNPIATPPAPQHRATVPLEDRRLPDERKAAPRPPAAAAEQKEAPRPEPTRPAPPFAGPARPAARAPARTEPAARAVQPQAPLDAEVRPVSAASRPHPQPRRSPQKPRAIPAATAEALLRAATPPVVALPPNFHDEAIRSERWRRIGFAIAAASFLSAIALSTVRSRSGAVAQAAINEATLAGTVAPSAPIGDKGPVPISLTAAVDSLSGALAYYREIEADHRGGLVGCRILDRAYALVDRARVRADSARRSIAGVLGDTDSIRVSMLSAEYTHVAQTYRRSGCK